MSHVTGQRLIALGLLAAVLLNYPFMSLFMTTVMPGGIPLLAGYLLIIWLAIIALVALAHRSSGKGSNPADGD